MLIDAAGRLREEGRRFHLTLAGEGPMRAAIEAAIAEHDLTSMVEITGWVDYARVRDELERSRALVLPSFAEGLPIAIMESLALERPVVTTTVAGIPELVDRSCGWVVPAGSVDALADALRSVLDASPEELAALGAAGRRRVLEHHDVDRSAARLHELFTSR